MQQEKGHSKYLYQMFKEKPPKKKDPESNDRQGLDGSLGRDYADDMVDGAGLSLEL